MTAARQPCPSITAPPITVPNAIPIEIEVPKDPADQQAAAPAPAAAPNAKKTKDQLAQEARDKAAQEKARADKRAAAAVSLLAQLTTLEVAPDAVARVVINERTGTVVAGGDVRLLPVAIAQGGITIAVRETAQVSQPGALSNGNTAVVTQTDVQAQEPTPEMRYLSGATSLAEVAKALSSFGLSSRELASTLQALRSAGALRAEIIVQ